MQSDGSNDPVEVTSPVTLGDKVDRILLFMNSLASNDLSMFENPPIPAWLVI